jgi:hypothetical protein
MPVDTNYNPEFDIYAAIGILDDTEEDAALIDDFTEKNKQDLLAAYRRTSLHIHPDKVGQAQIAAKKQAEIATAAAVEAATTEDEKQQLQMEADAKAAIAAAAAKEEEDEYASFQQSMNNAVEILEDNQSRRIYNQNRRHFLYGSSRASSASFARPAAAASASSASFARRPVPSAAAASSTSFRASPYPTSAPDGRSWQDFKRDEALKTAAENMSLLEAQKKTKIEAEKIAKQEADIARKKQIADDKKRRDEEESRTKSAASFTFGMVATKPQGQGPQPLGQGGKSKYNKRHAKRSAKRFAKRSAKRSVKRSVKRSAKRY